MGKRIKRGTKGNAVNYLTRTRAIRKLQVSLKDFRRLCIFKGIHPREPRKKKHGADKTYYHIKDLRWLAHEQVLHKLREEKAWNKKVKRAAGKLNYDETERLEVIKPKYKLDHLVRERYPSFIDALRDLDDPLTMVHLFACLPAVEKTDVNIPQNMCELAKRLAMEFQAYIARTHSLRKVFISVKGYYYQAEVMGQCVTWLAPHQVSQLIPEDVDWMVLTTFLEFYETMMTFVNFKLYHSLSLRYPPVLDKRLSDAAAHLEAIMKDLARPSFSGREEAHTASGLAEISSSVRERMVTLPDKIDELTKQGTARQDDCAEGAEAMDAKESEAESGSDMPEIDSGSDESLDNETSDGAAGADVPLPEVADACEQGASDSGDDVGPSAQEVEGEKAAGATVGVDSQDEATLCERLFNGLVFFLGREVPMETLLFVIRSFGGSAGWCGEGSPVSEADDSITHQVVDRPSPKQMREHREYIQPQWVFDSANARLLLPADGYAPGKTLPPHLSPFVDYEDEGYVPDYALQIKRLQESANLARNTISTGIADQTFVAETAREDPEMEEQASLEAAKEAEEQYLTELGAELGTGDNENGPSGGASSGSKAPTHVKGKHKKKRTAEQVAADAKAMDEMMIRKKDRWIYNRIRKREGERTTRVAKLKRKRDAIAAKGVPDPT
ncbi:unnamed protein product [Ostreobium quekettii]|uniref:Pescadillo homolog n=1 Tax=Ostreobium quekettii TaxID=121088 RepID=A0A8S1IS02_9CHLO|nr:unnamed protein product [Ostreobium quekettii]